MQLIQGLLIASGLLLAIQAKVSNPREFFTGEYCSEAKTWTETTDPRRYPYGYCNVKTQDKQLLPVVVVACTKGYACGDPGSRRKCVISKWGNIWAAYCGKDQTVSSASLQKQFSADKSDGATWQNILGKDFGEMTKGPGFPQSRCGRGRTKKDIAAYPYGYCPKKGGIERVPCAEKSPCSGIKYACVIPTMGNTEVAYCGITEQDTALTLSDQWLEDHPEHRFAVAGDQADAKIQDPSSRGSRSPLEDSETDVDGSWDGGFKKDEVKRLGLGVIGMGGYSGESGSDDDHQSPVSGSQSGDVETQGLSRTSKSPTEDSEEDTDGSWDGGYTKHEVKAQGKEVIGKGGGSDLDSDSA